MIRFLLHQFVMDWETCLIVLEQYKKLAASNPNDVVFGQEQISISQVVRHLKFHCDQLKLDKSSDRLWRLQLRLERKACTNSFIRIELEELTHLIEFELDESTLVLISKEKSKYFEGNDDEKDVFRGTIIFNFTEAWNDFKCAGNSLAADLYDAAAFYLMRVVEIGLRDLARNLGINKLAKAPLDYAGWKAVVSAIDDKLSAKMPKTRGAKQSAALKFKHDLLADFKAFEVLRNEIMHGRSHHNEQEAIGLYNRVGEFMQRLAQSYGKRTKPKKRNTV